MDLRDARKLSPAELEDRRKLTVKLRNSGKTYAEVAKVVGVHRNAVSKWCDMREQGENRIKELKQDFGLSSFCLKYFWATEASFRFTMVAYNLLSLFRHTALNEHKRGTLQTLRSYCFALGAWTSTHAKKKVLKISLPHQKRRWMNSIFKKISDLTLPYDYSTA